MVFDVLFARLNTFISFPVNENDNKTSYVSSLFRVEKRAEIKVVPGSAILLKFFNWSLTFKRTRSKESKSHALKIPQIADAKQEKRDGYKLLS